MKKVLFSVFFFSLMIVGAQAQKSTCSKATCTAKPTSATMSSGCGEKATGTAQGSAENNAAAAKLASLDPTIETRTCPVSGTVTYVRKQAGTGTAEATYVDLAYDATSNSFVNVSPINATHGTVKTEGAAGCGAKSTTGGKSCCSGAGAAKMTSTTTTTTTGTTPACCAGKGKTASSGSNKN